jgi:hypothetical protein
VSQLSQQATPIRRLMTKIKKKKWRKEIKRKRKRISFPE